MHYQARPQLMPTWTVLTGLVVTDKITKRAWGWEGDGRGRCREQVEGGRDGGICSIYIV